ncbi:heat stress transcription factor C-1-like [Bidens hawaiensis]|uniref:heat stress transcription factor C-1-like n=1 Tax=Bidens hawaiensis TaxID=980011 RepID=UPI00404A2AF1
MDSNDIIAPFILKTYHMVNDPSLDGFIRWGLANNTFIVVDPLEFSQRLLPANFKHNNFSSFVRQLNTYGFKKVDPDRWEFANEWFLKGQTHLLKNIGRKKHNNSNSNSNSYSTTATAAENDNNIIRYEDEMMTIEIAKLKQEQKALEQELLGMNKRLEATERRPEQMMALLHKVADDPEILPRMMLEKDQRLKRLVDNKRQRVVNTPTNEGTSSMSWRWTGAVDVDNEVEGNFGGFDVDNFVGFSPEPENRTPAGYPFTLFGSGF